VPLLLLLSLALAASPTDLERIRVNSEKLAMDVQASRNCEVNPDNGYTQCHYSYEGLRFTRRILQEPVAMMFVEVESLAPGRMSVVFSGRGPCISLSLGSDNPANVAQVFVNVNDGRIDADGKKIGCFPKSGSGR
jgi:hypothetical protein